MYVSEGLPNEEAVLYIEHAHLLDTNERQAVLVFLELIGQHYPGRVLQTVLFGSKARGDSQPWSDIDIGRTINVRLIIADQESWQLSHAISNLAARVPSEWPFRE